MSWNSICCALFHRMLYTIIIYCLFTAAAIVSEIFWQKLFALSNKIWEITVKFQYTRTISVRQEMKETVRERQYLVWMVWLHADLVFTTNIFECKPEIRKKNFSANIVHCTFRRFRLRLFQLNVNQCERLSKYNLTTFE